VCYEVCNYIGYCALRLGLLHRSQPITIPINSTRKINTEREIKKELSIQVESFLDLLSTNINRFVILCEYLDRQSVKRWIQYFFICDGRCR
jgi:hypothetical protein